MSRHMEVSVPRQLLLCLAEIAEIQKALAFAMLEPTKIENNPKIGGLAVGLVRESQRLQELVTGKPAAGSTEALLHAPPMEAAPAPISAPLGPIEGLPAIIPPPEA